MNYEEVKKVCTRCRENLPLSKFSKHTSGRYGKNSMRILCDSKRVAEWQKKNPETFKATQRRFAQKPETKRYKKDWQLKKRYGISLEEYEVMLASQDSCCAICGVCCPLHVDHDHKTTLVRGLLCGKCNKGLGCFDHDTKFLASAVQYLERNVN